MKYSIVTCVYGNPRQFKNSLLAAMSQNCNFKYEVIVVDNGTPDSGIFDACYNFTVPDNRSLGYMRIDPSEKKTFNTTQGTNMGAQAAVGEIIVVLADPNVLLSYNFLSEVDNLMNYGIIVTSSNCDVKLSPKGTKDSEYEDIEGKEDINSEFLSKLGWPKDPMDFNLDLVPHRYPPPHQNHDVYVFAMSRELFLKDGGYDESETGWGLYHTNLVKKFCHQYTWIKLRNVRVVHQYHGLTKGVEMKPGKYSKQFEIMRCRRI